MAKVNSDSRGGLSGWMTSAWRSGTVTPAPPASTGMPETAKPQVIPGPSFAEADSSEYKRAVEEYGAVSEEERKIVKDKVAELNKALYASDTPEEAKTGIRKDLRKYQMPCRGVVLKAIFEVIIPMASLMSPLRDLIDRGLHCNAMVIAAVVGHPSDNLLSVGAKWAVFRKVRGVDEQGNHILVSVMNVLSGIVEREGMDAYRRIAPILGLIMANKPGSLYAGKNVLVRDRNGTYSVDATELKKFKKAYLKPFRKSGLEATRVRVSGKMGKLFKAFIAELATNPKEMSMLLDKFREVSEEFVIVGQSTDLGKKKRNVDDDDSDSD